MKLNQQFGMAIHILVYLNIKCDDLCTSDQLAETMKTHPVVIRRLLLRLKKSGFVETKRGHGGTRLGMDAKKISLLHVYEVFADEDILNTRLDLNEQCPVGSSMNPVIYEELNESIEALKQSLSQKTIADISEKIKKNMKVRGD